MIEEGDLHLLHLPREVRDHIFSYLWHHIEFDWRWNHWPLTGGDGIANVCIEKAPYPSLLLTNAQLHDEYAESASHCAPYVTLKVRLGTTGVYHREEGRYHGLMDQILPRISRLRIILYNNRPGNNMTSHFWFEIYLLGQVLRDQARRMDTFELIAYTPSSPLKDEQIRHLPRSNMPATAYRLSPRLLATNFALLRHVKGPSLDYGGENGSDLVKERELRNGVNDTLDCLDRPGMVLLGRWIYERTEDKGQHATTFA
ncbi:hypothetical protein BKA63DRAFT_572749 [Paraphoma chrysanthemicola]|nr:hypothetical protein BKA63DRAFT_572749 [Paraphoma chrysanthemicola]